MASPPSPHIMGQVYPRVGLDCVGLGQKFSTFNESVWDGSNSKKCVNVYQGRQIWPPPRAAKGPAMPLHCMPTTCYNH